MVEVSYIDVSHFTERIYREIASELSPARAQKAERLLRPLDRHLSIAAGYLLSCALKKAGLSEKDAQYFFNQNGKPFIKGFCFNLSHSGTVAALAVASGEVGIDVERVRPVSSKLYARVCTQREREYLNGLEKEAQQTEFFRLWTAKESAAKFLGTGLKNPAEFETDLRLLTVRRGEEALNAALKEYPLAGYSLTVCAQEEFGGQLKKVNFNGSA